MAQEARKNGTTGSKVLTVLEAQVEDLLVAENQERDMLSMSAGRFRWTLGTRIGVRDTTGDSDFEAANRDDLLVLAMGFADTHKNALVAIMMAVGGTAPLVDHMLTDAYAIEADCKIPLDATTANAPADPSPC